MAEGGTILVQLEINTGRLSEAMREAALAATGLADAMFAILPWWARTYLTIRHPVEAIRRYRRAQDKRDKT